MTLHCSSAPDRCLPRTSTTEFAKPWFRNKKLHQTCFGLRSYSLIRRVCSRPCLWQDQRQHRGYLQVLQASGLPDPEDQNRSAIDARARVRSEVLAPFRIVRLVLYGFFALSATVGLVIALTQLAAGVAQAPNALPVRGTLEGIAIDVGAIVIFSLLFRSDWQARQKQIARLTREERLGALQLELSNKKTVRMAQLRRFARPVLVAGTPDQVEASVNQAEQLREELIERGVLIVALPVFGSEGQRSQTPQLTQADLKFKAIALRQNAWREWFTEQLQLAKANPEKGLYVSLRMDGRVRASGVGSPPWQRLVRELAPVKGANQNLLRKGWILTPPPQQKHLRLCDLE